MGDADVIAATRIVGRDSERRLLRERIDGAAAGQPCAVFVHGEAGIGKTSLVRSVVAEAARGGVTVLWGRCLRFGAVESTYLPFVLAIEGWLQEAPTAEREAVLSDVSGAALLLPSLGGAGPAAPVRLMPVVDDILSRIVAFGPTVLVVDDVQWAAPASWDALGYLCAGFRHQPLAVITTHRDEEQSPGDPFLGWLADMRRMPSITTLPLGRLRPEETEDQLVGLLGGPVRRRLLDQVSDRSGGNPYLTEMLVEGLSAETACLPDGLPDALGEALLAAWHRMSSPARKVAQVLAVGGRPAGLADLAEVAAARGLGASAVEDAVDEAVARGIVVPARAGVWFRHPLLAEILLSTLLPGQAAPWHAAWATTLERVPATGIEELRRLAALALHHEEAADPTTAVAFSLRAARLAHELGAPRAEARHLQRAVRLAGPAGILDGPASLDLLEQTAHACALVDDQERAAGLWHQALALVDERVDPLRASRLLVALSAQEWGLGRVEEQPVGTARRCVELTRGHPDSAEHAEALANLAFCAAWAGDGPTAVEAARSGVAAARRSGSSRALTAAHGARAFVLKDADSCRDDIDEALHHAERSDDLELLVDAYISRFNYHWDRGRVAECAAMSRQALTDLLARGGVIGVPLFAGILADSLLSMGRIQEAAGVVRDGLAVGGLGTGASFLRLVAAVCAVRLGRLPDADQHLVRAYELIPTLEERPGLGAPPLVAEVLLARGEPGAALEMVTRTLEVQSVDARMVDLMLVGGARAAADLADHARDRRDTDGVRRARELLDRLVEQRDGLAGVPFTPMVPDDLALPALRAVFEAESARCTGTEGLAPRWAEVAGLCDRADLGWEAQLARMRQAACLCDERAGRAEIAGPLGEVHRFAVQEEAVALRHRAEGIARLARVSLVHPGPAEQQLPALADGGPFGSLTGREREILGHLVNGLTYAQIARTLFISEKTVSSHVSNVLRKTGTSSRHEVSALSMRVATTDSAHLGAKGSAVHNGAHDLPRPP